ncbi:hypothetical protein M3M38_04935 [Fructilactobacillus cliffordii]|uniref:hypothetical protein n=1 Tax=Fructilactobacillus cliffordii TaxID=2940299 RepID=UPI002093514F|nr:hypothetical protein [Fructilactobacillus cliffordii]USS86048.1 hypothetical protein M3M38_04935 [Fructilactobacillus cliffordii]
MIVNNLNQTIRIETNSKTEFKRMLDVIRPSAQTRKSLEYRKSVKQAQSKLNKAAF